MNYIPKVIREGKIKLGDIEIRVCFLDNGQRVIPEDDMKKAFDFLGLTEDDVECLLNRKLEGGAR